MLKIIPLVVLATTCFAEPSELVDSLDTADPTKPAYRNPSLPTEVRVKDLLSRMTVDEKLAQLGKLQAFRAYDRVDGHIVLKPHSVGQIPVHSGGYAANRPRYIDGPGDAAYPFGHGLSYTTFAYSGLEVTDADEASVSVTNTGSRDGDEIVRIYFSVKGSGRQRPHRELLAFRRVSLKAGETRRVTLPFDRRLFGGYGRDGAYEPPHGEVSIWVDGCKDRVALRRLAGRGKTCEGI